VAFPYWEVWTVPKVEDRFFGTITPSGGGVFVCYPGKSARHEDERQNRLEADVWPLDLLIKRWRKARCRGSTYLAIGDGGHHIQSEYFPDTSGISLADERKIVQSVFADADCPGGRSSPTDRAADAFPVSVTAAGCLEADTAYEPLDMEGQSLIAAGSPEECQRLCVAVDDCQHFSYVEALGHCHLEDAFATKASGRLGFSSGPAACSAAAAEAGSSKPHFSPAETSCLEPGISYSPTLGHAQPLGAGLSQREAILECQSRCAVDYACAHFTVSTGLPGSTTLLCSLADKDAGRWSHLLRHLSGPPHCGHGHAGVQRKFINGHASGPGFFPAPVSIVAISAAAAVAVIVALRALKRPVSSRRAATQAAGGGTAPAVPEMACQE